MDIVGILEFQVTLVIVGQECLAIRGNLVTADILVRVPLDTVVIQDLEFQDTLDIVEFQVTLVIVDLESPDIVAIQE